MYLYIKTFETSIEGRKFGNSLEHFLETVTFHSLDGTRKVLQRFLEILFRLENLCKHVAKNSFWGKIFGWNDLFRQN